MMRRMGWVVLGLSLLMMGCKLVTGPAPEQSASVATKSVSVTLVSTVLPEQVTPEVSPQTTATLIPLPTSALPYTMVTVSTQNSDLLPQLQTEILNAQALNRRPFAFWTAEWCENCKELLESLDDPRMSEALRGTYIITIDLDVWREQGALAGMQVMGVPAFYELGPDGKATGRTITGAAWGANTPANMAPPLQEFFQKGK